MEERLTFSIPFDAGWGDVLCVLYLLASLVAQCGLGEAPLYVIQVSRTVRDATDLSQ